MPITYPRNTNARYTVHNEQTGTDVRSGVPYGRLNGEQMENLDSELVWLEEVQLEVLDYNELTHTITPSIERDIENGLLIRGWQIIELPEDEKTQRRNNAIEEEKNRRIASILPFEDHIATIAKGLSFTDRAASGQPLSPLELSERQAIRDVWSTIGQIIEAANQIKQAGLSENPYTSNLWP